MKIIKNDSNGEIHAWIDGIEVEEQALQQLSNVSSMPFIFKHVASMPDVHVGVGTCIGSVIATKGAIIPSVVGVDLSCGMIALKTNLTVGDVPNKIRQDIYDAIDNAVPTGRSNNGGEGDCGSWDAIPSDVEEIWNTKLKDDFETVLSRNPKIKSKYNLNALNHLGTLGGGNHFIEVCLDLDDNVWIMLHSGSRGVGNRIGTYFITVAKEICQNGSKEQLTAIKEEMIEYYKSDGFLSLSSDDKRVASANIRNKFDEKKNELAISLPDPDLAYLEEGTEVFDNYLNATFWAQKFAYWNREIMLNHVIKAIETVIGKDVIRYEKINCHHNYVSQEEHFEEKVYVTRKGAINAEKGTLGIIPGSMGKKSYIVEGLGCEDAFCSASHGAGRKMSRTQARDTFTVEEHKKATEGVVCCKAEQMLDETPAAYKDIDTVMEAQKELVKPIYQIKQIICIKGTEE